MRNLKKEGGNIKIDLSDLTAVRDDTVGLMMKQGQMEKDGTRNDNLQGFCTRSLIKQKDQ